MPFDQLVMFSTNLEPRDLVDEAFLRRIPYKIEMVDPTEEEFRRLFEMLAPKLGFATATEADRLPDRHALPEARTGRSASAIRAICSPDLQLLQLPQAFRRR